MAIRNREPMCLVEIGNRVGTIFKTPFGPERDKLKLELWKDVLTEIARGISYNATESAKCALKAHKDSDNKKEELNAQG